MKRRLAALLLMMVFVATMVFAFGSHHHSDLGESSGSHCSSCVMLASSAVEQTADSPEVSLTDFGLPFSFFFEAILSDPFSREPPARAPPLA